MALRIADVTVPEAEVLPKAVEMARALCDKDRTTLVALKRAMYPDLIAALEAAAG